MNCVPPRLCCTIEKQSCKIKENVDNLQVVRQSFFAGFFLVFCLCPRALPLRRAAVVVGTMSRRSLPCCSTPFAKYFAGVFATLREAPGIPEAGVRPVTATSRFCRAARATTHLCRTIHTINRNRLLPYCNIILRSAPSSLFPPSRHARGSTAQVRRRLLPHGRFSAQQFFLCTG